MLLIGFAKTKFQSPLFSLVQVDASGEGIGVVLAQADPGEEFSCALSQQEASVS